MHIQKKVEVESAAMKEATMTQDRSNERKWGNSPSTLLPMLIGGLVLTVIAMVMVAVFT